MLYFDLILLILLGGFVLFGLWFGLIHVIGALLGTIFGALMAGNLYDRMALWAEPFFLGNLNLARVVCFLIIFGLIYKLIGFLFMLVNKIFKLISIIPFLKTFNRLGGAILGLLEGLLVIGLFLYMANKYPIGEWFENMLEASQIAPAFITISKIFTPFLPDFLTKIQGVI